jgi:hypothetical protein
VNNLTDKSATFWSNIAKAFKNSKNVIGYELLNGKKKKKKKKLKMKIKS